MQNFWQNLPKPFFVLAPMEAVTDVVFRHIIAKAAPADIYFTEFTNSTSFVNPKGKHSTRGRLEFTEDEYPMVAQIWGAVPEHFAHMAQELKKMGFAGIDINMGCPDKSVIKTGSCSALIENHSLAAEIIAATKEAGLPVSVKTRLGFKTQKTEEWGSFLLSQDLAALTIHARTQKEMSKVPARWEEVAKIVKLRDEIAPQTLIIGNGDVRDRQHGETLAREYGVDGVMIGRGIFQNPFAFEKEAREHSKEELLELLHLQLNLYDEAIQKHPRKFDPLKRFFKIYIRGFAGASELRAQLMQCKTTAEVRNILKSA
ncbi:tRNA-dihydrouridine synthase [Candidatus Saccharibacteria bacterium]|nr:tRNA-dihydrouridine synthase [Candidatus Saccharibacteria bacterium]